MDAFNKAQKESINGLGEAFAKFAKQAPSMIESMKANLSTSDLKTLNKVMKDNGLEEKMSELKSVVDNLNKKVNTI